jgi:hypothetical protein
MASRDERWVGHDLVSHGVQRFDNPGLWERALDLFA